ncbi:hypothetical protein R615_17225 [Thalassolituus oleivorans R6-15]|uniref:Uncharacterized protein n=1 Tax=Thalassolituus oleivorans MIL-1 TaxID=1298593 RepID=M5DW65_9GAMM|nr:hypothetical protein R615_17225 [Thalassolituus oleivorans R6-15]CCU74062.1 hypothetical protein TOL_3679 [Thalassolituus oleivorans MIL-1]
MPSSIVEKDPLMRVFYFMQLTQIKSVLRQQINFSDLLTFTQNIPVE